MTKSIEKIFQPNEMDVLKFVIRKVSTKRYNAMSQQDRLDAIAFIEECEGALSRFKTELKNGN